jgi:hypothetical protein
MAYEQRDNNGTLFKNDKKDPNDPSDKKPHYTGEAMVNGEAVRISAWVKDGKNGKFMSLAFSPKDGGNRPARSSRNDEDEGSPF